MDLALNDHRINGKTATQIYQKKFGGKNIIEENILNALNSSCTSLFKVISIFLDKHVILLRDILNSGQMFQLTDIGFSVSTTVGQLLFARLLEFDDFSR